MNKWVCVALGLLIGGGAAADDISESDEIVCAPSELHICVENDSCYAASTSDLDVPEFVIIDVDNKTISTTKASNDPRTTTFANVRRESGLIYLQGIENERAFSFVIDESTGRMSVALSSDGISVSAFGACTDVDL